MEYNFYPSSLAFSGLWVVDGYIRMCVNVEYISFHYHIPGILLLHQRRTVCRINIQFIKSTTTSHNVSSALHVRRPSQSQSFSSSTYYSDNGAPRVCGCFVNLFILIHTIPHGDSSPTRCLFENLKSRVVNCKDITSRVTPFPLLFFSLSLLAGCWSAYITISAATRVVCKFTLFSSLYVSDCCAKMCPHRPRGELTKGVEMETLEEPVRTGAANELGFGFRIHLRKSWIK